MSEPMPTRRETAFAGTGMETVCEMVVSSSDSVGVAGGAYFLLYQKGMNEYGPSLTLTKRRENQSATG